MEKKVIKLCQELIKIKSYSGQEKEVAEYLKQFFVSEGFDTVTCDEYGNVVAGFIGKEKGKKILFDGHMDIVPEGDEKDWTYLPFGGEIANGNIYGRGATDMKGPLSSMICGIIDFHNEHKDKFQGELYIACSVHEECFEGVASKAISRAIKPDYVVIGEPSSFHIKIGQKGRAEIAVEVFGKAAHSSNPKKGINAVYKMMEIVREIQKIPATTHEILGESVIELVDIISAPYPSPSIIPDYCKAIFDRRLLVGETREFVLNQIEEAIAIAKEKDPNINATVSYSIGKDKCYTGKDLEAERFFSAWVLEDEMLIDKISKGVEKSNITPQVSQWYFCTNGSHYAGDEKIKTFGIGPSLEHLAHTVDEHISIADLVKGVECYKNIISEMFNK